MEYNLKNVGYTFQVVYVSQNNKTKKRYNGRGLFSLRISVISSLITITVFWLKTFINGGKVPEIHGITT